MHWAGDSQSLASASQDGKLLLWNALTTNKLKSISLKSSYVMTVGMEPTKGRLVACGGLDNLCTIYKWADGSILHEMTHHDGFISCCRFLHGEHHVVTSSGDSTLIKWDVEKGLVMDTYAEHKKDVMCLALSPTDPNVMCSGSVDRTVKVWDLRSPKMSVQTFDYHDGDVNGVDFMHNGLAIGTASGDGTARLFDLRAHACVDTFGTANETEEEEGLTSASFSKSGRILFVGHADGDVLAWDVLSGSGKEPAFVLAGAHEKHVTSIGVNPKGDALCTASWDTMLKIWA